MDRAAIGVGCREFILKVLPIEVATKILAKLRQPTPSSPNQTLFRERTFCCPYPQSRLLRGLCEGAAVSRHRPGQLLEAQNAVSDPAGEPQTGGATRPGLRVDEEIWQLGSGTEQ